MKEVLSNLYVGTVGEAYPILRQQDEWHVANVAKTLHLDLHGWSSADRNSPYYIIHENFHWISVNWVDSPNYRLFDYQNNGVNVVKQVLAFIQKSLEEGKKVLITCDQAQSRSPSIALLYLAKRAHTITDTSFADAKRDFLQIYPRYAPSGIADFLSAKWEQI